MTELKKKIVEKQIKFLENELNYWKSALDIKVFEKNNNFKTFLLTKLDENGIETENVMVETPVFISKKTGDASLIENNIKITIKNCEINKYDYGKK